MMNDLKTDRVVIETNQESCGSHFRVARQALNFKSELAMAFFIAVDHNKNIVKNKMDRFPPIRVQEQDLSNPFNLFFWTSTMAGGSKTDKCWLSL